MNKIDWVDKKNLSMLADFYEFTMANGYLENGMENKIAYFDMFFLDTFQMMVVLQLWLE